MSTLHIVQHTRLPSLNSVLPGDGVLLIGDAVVYACSDQLETLRACIGHDTELHVLRDDIRLRGLHIDDRAHCQTIDYHGFVALTLQHHLIKSC